jgi:hypothetical protein
VSFYKSNGFFASTEKKFGWSNLVDAATANAVIGKAVTVGIK